MLLRDQARKIAEAIDERANTDAADKAVTVSVATNETRPGGVPAGAGRPTFIRYRIEISDGTRLASLDLGQAEALLGSLDEGCGAGPVFDAVRSQGVPVGDAPG